MLKNHASEILNKLSTLDITSTLHNLTNSVDSLDTTDLHRFSHRASSAANLAPEQLQFNTTQTTYNPGETVSLTGGWVYDGDGYTNLATVDFWLLPQGGDWLNIEDATSFTPWSEDSNWGSFNYDLSDLSAGNYTLWGQAFDQSGAFSNEYQVTFSVNQAPEQLQFSTTQDIYNVGDTVSLTGGWVYDGDGYTNLAAVDFWLLPEGGDWLNIDDVTSFTPGDEDSNRGSFNYNLSNLSAGNYTLWGQAYDQLGGFSNEYQVTFSVVSVPTIIQLTNNSDNDLFPQISGNNVVWLNYGDSNPGFYYYNGSTTTQLTNYISDDFLNIPAISGNNVVWYGSDGNDLEIFFYDGNTTVQLTDNSYDDYYLGISGNNVAWSSYVGNDWEIYFYDGNTTIQLTDNISSGIPPRMLRISGNNVVWSSYDGNDWEIYFYDGNTTIQVTDNSYDDEYPWISGNNVVWVGYDYDQEIYFYNGNTTIQLTDNTYDDYNPRISGNNIVWNGSDGNDLEIYYYNGSTTTQLTNNSYDDKLLDISGNNVVWSGYDGNDYEIYFYNVSGI